MQKLYTYLTTLFLLLLAAACTDEEYAPASGTQPGEGYRITVSIPAPMEAATRSIGDALTSDYVTTLPLFVLVFDENGFFTAFEQATVESYDADTRQGTYTVDLPPSDGKCVLHFVLGLSEDDFATYTPDDSEASIFSRLTVGGNKDAYWQRVEVEHVIKTLSENGETVTAISAPPLTDEGYIVKLVRNFAQVSLVNKATETFELQGFTIVNEPLEGTVAPYSGSETNGGFATFELPSVGDKYEEFTSINLGFGGNNAGKMIDGTAPVDEAGRTDFTLDSKYVYERNQDEARSPAYILLKGVYNGRSYYYKLDIVSTDPTTWITSYLNLYRNFHYTITINSVAGEGYTSIKEAMEAVASNNIGASVEVSEVNTIQDGKDQLYVSTLDTLLTKADVAEIHYEFREGINMGNGTVNNDRVHIYAVGGSGENGLNPNAVKSFDYADGVLRITPAALPALMEEQEFIVTVEESGLSRRILVRVHQPFRFEVVDCDDVVENTIGSELTLVVRLPNNMPTSAFPLTLDIEPDLKSIYPDVSKNRIPVETQGDYTFSYRATVTYNEYRLNRTLFFHFKTNMSQSATSIKVTNRYFLDENNVASFENGNKTFDFEPVTLSGADGTWDSGERTFQFNGYDTSRKELTLTFHLPCGDTEHTTLNRPVEIFADYLDFSMDDSGHLLYVESETGTCTLRTDGQCIFYTPKQEYLNSEQRITFVVTQDYASETIQLSAWDHNTATVDYVTPPCKVKCLYKHGFILQQTEPIARGSDVSLYTDEELTNLVNTYEVTSNDGLITIRSFVGFDSDDVLYFAYSERGTTYVASATVAELTQGTVTLTLERIW